MDTDVRDITLREQCFKIEEFDRLLALQMNLTATAPACRRNSTPVQTPMMTSQLSRAVVDVTLIASFNGRRRATSTADLGTSRRSDRDDSPTLLRQSATLRSTLRLQS